MIRRERPICEHCGVAPSRMVDHIVPLRAGGARLDLANLQALCLTCHAAKTRSERRRR